MEQRSRTQPEGTAEPLRRAEALESGALPPPPVPVRAADPPREPPRPIPLGPGSPSAGAGTPPAPIPVRAVPNTPVVLSQQQKQQHGVAVGGQGWRRCRKAVGVREELEERAEEGAAAVMWRDFVHQHRSWAVSAAFHAVLVLILGLTTFSISGGQIDLTSLAHVIEDFEPESVDTLRIDKPEIEGVSSDVVGRVELTSLDPKVDVQSAGEGIDAASAEVTEFGIEKAPYNDLLTELGRGTGRADARGTGQGNRGLGLGILGAGTGLGQRGSRRGDAVGRGATRQSEEAVDLALKWLAEHQLYDGSWSYHHHVAPSCQGQCPDPGQIPEARIAATAMGVLPFLGAGQTNQLGQYQRTVAAGLNYLMRRMELQPQGGKLSEKGGRMYSHGLATIALCEAYAMQVDPRTVHNRQLAYYRGDGHSSPGEAPPKPRQPPIPLPGLGRAAQAALDFVTYAQDPVGGGWRYEPREPGDTSMVGWQLMAWMSGKMSYLRVSPLTAVRAGHYLDHVQVDQYGADYGYTDKTKRTKGTQAIGLLCRMYLGWPREHPGITEGVQQMSRSGPSPGYMYYDYYATQVLHHYGGEEWERWNPRMRDSLVGSQSKAGHTAGSWHFPGGDRGADKGGRLYCTSLAAMTLEVYYRHMPLYGKNVLKHAGVPEDQPAEKAEEDQAKDEF